MKENQKHLTLSDRIKIEQALNSRFTFRAIAKILDKDPTTISKEVRKHRFLKERKSSKPKPCIHEKRCIKEKQISPYEIMYFCKKCSEYEEKTCPKKNKTPYVCNGCPSLPSCTYRRVVYSAKIAQDQYEELRSSSREGINQSADSIQQLDALITPLLQNGQTMGHIYATQGSNIPCSRRTLYYYIDKGVFRVRNIDLPRKVKYKVRKSGSKRTIKNTKHRIGRSFVDFDMFIRNNPELSVVEMDTVEGSKGGKVLLTLLFRMTNLMLIFIMDTKTQDATKEVLDYLEVRLGTAAFRRLFSIILTDNGSEFTNSVAIETSIHNGARTKVFYCDPNASWQKGKLEKNHEYIRKVLPKGSSFDTYTQKDIDILVHHINSTARDSINGYTPFILSTMMLDKKLFSRLNLKCIRPEDVLLKPRLLKH